MTPDPWKIKELIEQKFPDELQLLIRLCSPDEPDEKILADLSRHCDWNIFLDLTDRHRMLPFLAPRKNYFSHLMPADAMAQLNNKLDIHKHTALFRTNEVFRLSNLFEKNKIAVMPIKGPCMAWQLYGDVTSRLSHDLDFIISGKNQDPVVELMKEAGYDRQKVFSPRQTEYYHTKLTHHYSFFSRQGKTLVEMHWRLFMNKYLYPVTADEIIGNSIAAEIAGNKVRLMNDEMLLHYLCLHGSDHFWFRLHWLRDIAQIIHTQKTDLKSCIARAVELKIEKPVCEGLLLASLVFNHHFHGSVLPDIMKYSSDWFVRQSLAEINDVSYEKKSKRLSVIITKFKGKLHLKNDLAYRLNIMPLLKTTPSDWEKIGLPDRLFFLYKFLHPFLWVMGKIGGKKS